MAYWLAIVLRLLPLPGAAELATIALDALEHAASSPRVAAAVVSRMGRSDGAAAEMLEDLLRVCHRESRCRAIGEHGRDSHLSRTAWLGQVRLEHLDAECQPYGDGGWATRGAFGLSASAHWQYLPACYQPEAFDSSWVSAWVAARKWERRCEGWDCPAVGWCPGARSRRCRGR